MRHDLNPQSVHGWLSKEEGAALRDLARNVPKGGTILEIGTHHGRSTMYLSQGAFLAGAKVVTLEKDPGCEPMIRQAIEKFGAQDVVEPHIADSLEFAGDWDPARKIDLLFIDACHEYEAVIADSLGYLYHMALDGVVAYHDFNPEWWPGSHKAVTDLYPGWEHRVVARTLNFVALKLREMDYGVIDATCPGFSRRLHQTFFEHIIFHNDVHSVLMLGVLLGRDMAYICRDLAMTERDGCFVTGVDLFVDEPAKDWPDYQAAMGSWEKAMHLPPPNLEVARNNLARLGYGGMVDLIQSDAAEYCRRATLAGRKWDFVYLDTSHDFESTNELIQAAVPLVRPRGIIAGDDYPQDSPKWATKEAVEENFSDYQVWEDYCWWTHPENYTKIAVLPNLACFYPDRHPDLKWLATERPPGPCKPQQVYLEQLDENALSI